MSFIFARPHLIREELSNIEARLARTGKLERAGVCFQFITLDGFYNSYGINQLKRRNNLMKIINQCLKLPQFKSFLLLMFFLV